MAIKSRTFGASEFYNGFFIRLLGYGTVIFNVYMILLCLAENI